MKFISPSWDKIYSQSISLAERLKRYDDGGQYDTLVGVSRGGLALARIMSDLLAVQRVFITRCEYYTDLGTTRKKPVITQKISGELKGQRVLLVDDVADTGGSLIELKKYLASKKPRKVTIATLYIKPWTKVMPDYYVASTSAWIIFPWELLEAIQSISSKKKDGGSALLRRTNIPPKYLKRLKALNGFFKSGTDNPR
ncbi:MAG TPA: phosphoribosyltransferase [Nitrososphaerales archaeon]|nr:phosphoribosyltransferase [Nitrososphaerales archaeon]